MKKKLIWTTSIIVTILLGLWLLIYSITFHPDEIQSQEVSCKADMPTLKAPQKIKVLSWNVQYMGMGSSRNVFWYDLPAHMPEADKAKIKTVNLPTKADVMWTLDQVASVIKEINPDVVMIQEIDRHAGRTQNIDQVAELNQRLANQYGCSAEAYYWKADYVPHPNVATSVGMKLVTLSKYKIEKATRHQLALIPESWLKQQFNIKRAILETRLPVENGKEFVALNTHLSAFSQGSNTMELQVKESHEILTGLEKEGLNWIFGGDFNLLPPGEAPRRSLSKVALGYYKNVSEIKVLFKDFKSIITVEQMQGEDRAKYFTHLGNNPNYKAPDRTIDYVFYSDSLQLKSASIMQGKTLKISDHFPMIAEFQIQTTE